MYLVRNNTCSFCDNVNFDISQYQLRVYLWSDRIMTHSSRVLTSCAWWCHSTVGIATVLVDILTQTSSQSMSHNKSTKKMYYNKKVITLVTSHNIKQSYVSHGGTSNSYIHIRYIYYIVMTKRVEGSTL